MALFGELRLRLDPWQVEYGAEAPIAWALEGPDGDEVDLTVERGAEAWTAIRPGEVELPAVRRFVDGVRRIDARVVARTAERLVLGAFGSYAVGCVQTSDGRARFAEQRVGRVLVLGSGASVAGPVELSPALRYDTETVPDHEADAPVRRVHARMRALEQDFSNQQAAGGVLVLRDGPLTFYGKQAPEPSVVGYVKQLQRLYLPPSHLDHLAALAPGERTPLFALGARNDRFRRFSWFLRLVRPRLGDSELSGLVRCEVAEGCVERAIERADQASVLLPAHAGIRGLHPRAPQNLLPIAALEQRLRHELGDPVLVLRTVQDTLSREAHNYL